MQGCSHHMVLAATRSGVARRIGLALLVLALLPGCGPPPAPPEPEEAAARGPTDQDVIASIDEKSITVGQFRAALRQRAGTLREGAASAESREALLEDLLRLEVLATKARQRGYFDDPATISRIKRMIVARMEQDILQDFDKTLTIGPEEIETYYWRHGDEYGTPEKLRVALIYVRVPDGADEEQRAELASRAEEARDKAEALPATVRDFGHLAAEYSDDVPTRYDGGEAGWLSKGERHYRWDQSIIPSIFALATPGEVSPVMEAKEGFYIFRLIERHAAGIVPLSTVEANIRERLRAEKRKARLDAFYQESKRDLRISVDWQLLHAVSLSAPAPDGQAAVPTDQ